MLFHGSITQLEREELMNFRTSHLVGLLASALVILAATSGILSAAEPLKITGPDGESRQVLRQYGPTTSADTFWSIAQKTRPDASVSIYQVMAAIYDANPHAFTSDNYNSLEKGMILLIPSKEVMAAIPNRLAKQQAERNDKGWQQAKSPVTAEKAVPQTIVQPPVTKVDNTPAVSVESQQEIEALTAKLEAQQARNLSLTDELARAQDKLNLGSNDSSMLQGKIDELNGQVAELEEALLIQKEQKAELNSEVQQLRQQLAAATQPVVEEEPSDYWRTLMSSPLYLALAVAIPAILLLVIVWIALKRRGSADTDTSLVEESRPSEPEPGPVAGTAAVTATDDEMVAVHLDTDDDADSLDSLMSVDASQLKPEVELADDSDQLDMVEDMFVDAGDGKQAAAFEEEEGQSLDDLWAEAMGEQDEELSATETSQEDDLDSLLAELDTPAASKDSKELEDIDDEPPKPSDETDLDDMLAGFDPSTDTEQSDAEVEEEDLDALLAEFDLPQMSAQDEADEGVDLTEEIAAELGSDDTDVDEADLDSLLAEFDSTTQAQPSEDALIEEVTESADDDSEDVAAQIAAELESEEDETDISDDLDELLAGFEGDSSVKEPEETPVMDEAQVEAEPDLKSDDTSDDHDDTEDIESDKETDPKAALEFESFAIDDVTSLDPEAITPEATLDASVDDAALDALLADLEAVDNKEDKDKAESGFFDDLKGNKRGGESALDWEAELRNADEVDNDLSLDIKDDDNLTVDQALAALDAAESKKKTAGAAIDDHDLSAFQQDNGFIDIDRLLNEADEDETDVDQYKELDVDMGELDDLMSNAAMVDVDDEENAVNAKLDLARAYIEIDDIDSAKALLKEVELDGNDRQQEEALGLLKDL